MSYYENQNQEKEQPREQQPIAAKTSITGDGRIAGNPLGNAPVISLILKFSIPSIISMLVSAAYNITDQIFIGQLFGISGNAATNVAMPIVTISMALSLLIGVGGAANFNLNLGAKRQEEASRYIGNGIVLIAIAGVAACVLSLIFLRPLLIAFGATPEVLPLSLNYSGITALGLPFLILTVAGSHFVRADSRPTAAMICTITGALINVGLDALFMFVFNWGIAGAAWATVIGQIISGILTVGYLLKFRSVTLRRRHFRLSGRFSVSIARLGTTSFVNHFIMMVVQIAMNNTLRFYGEQSVYGSTIPLAVVGVVTKVNLVVIAFIVGIAQGCQPIFSFNSGAGNNSRVKETYKKAFEGIVGVSVVAFLLLQFFPDSIAGIFGSDSDAGARETYFMFARKYMRVFMFAVFISGIQPLCAHFFNSTGKAAKGIFLSLTRQGLFLVPLILILPLFFGMDGVLYAGPIADIAAVAVSLIMVSREMRKMNTEDKLKSVAKEAKHTLKSVAKEAKH
ncbi:MAG: MATE family efflux transporter [Oscillospiraceae bacterium]|jgi:Na+-driven multidrug efflux pump|nr:MATE family efflux transporter [Oscillospiraceae bacterium]